MIQHEEKRSRAAEAPGARSAARDSRREQALSEAQADPGAPLDAAMRPRLEASFGADLGGVRVHTGEASGQATRALGAKAFAQGQDIHFAPGRHAPGTPEGARLLAHEVAHTLQARHGGAGARDDQAQVSSRGDAVEREADEAAAAALRGERFSPAAAGAGMIMREEEGVSHIDFEPEHFVGSANASSHVAGDAARGRAVMSPDEETITPGRAGHSRLLHMRGETTQHAEAILAQMGDHQIKQVAPFLGGLDADIEKRGATLERFIMNVKEEEGFFNQEVLLRRSALDRAQKGQRWVQGNIKMLEAQRAGTEERFASFNAWAPRANGLISAYARYLALRDQLGVSDEEAMVAVLTEQLADAGDVVASAQFDYARKNTPDGPTEVEPILLPTLDNSVEVGTQGVNDAYARLNTSYLGFQHGMLLMRARDIDAEGDDERARLQEINQVKQTIRKIGATVDSTMGVIAGAPGAVLNAQQISRSATANVNAARNRHAQLAGKRPVYNPTHVALNEDGDMIIRNVQTGQDLDPASRERAAAPGSQGVSLPTNISDVLGQIADFAYADEVRQLQSTLEKIKNHCASVKEVAEMNQLREAAEHYQNALASYALACDQLQKTIETRRQDFLRLGEQLDAYARQSDAVQARGLAPQEGGERYATVLSLANQVAEVVTLAVAGRDAMGEVHPDEVERWAVEMVERRTAEPPRGFSIRLHPLKMDPEEVKRLVALHTEVSRYKGAADAAEETLGPVKGALNGFLKTATSGGR